MKNIILKSITVLAVAAIVVSSDGITYGENILIPTVAMFASIGWIGLFCTANNFFHGR